MERIDFGEENDPKGFVWVELERGRALWQFKEVDCRPFITLRVDCRRAGNPTQVVLEEILRHDLRDAVVRAIINVDPENDLLLQERAIHMAIQEAGANHVAVVQRQVERPARMRLGPTPEGLTPDQLLDRYLASKEVSPDRIDLLLEHARQIFDGEE
jgi:exonuclease SbcD